MASASSIGMLQQCLERLYEVSSGCDIERFLITDPELLKTLERNPAVRETSEKLLVREHGGGLDLALYLDAATMTVLRDNDPVRSLNDGNLVEFWTALEGVSHFLYLVWNARHGRCVSRFELELQAEVDKFAAAALLIGRQRALRIPRELHQRLFADPVFESGMDTHEERRYHRANYYAGLYCERLQQDCLRGWRSSMVRELRRFYRLTHRHKLRHISGKKGDGGIVF
jgi:hypothetical protein